MSLFRKRLRDDNDLTDEQISFLKNKSVVNDKEGEMMEVGEEDENNLAIGRDETGIDEEEEMVDDVGEVYTEDEEEVDDLEEEGESDGMSEEEEEGDLQSDQEMKEDNCSKEDGEEMEEEYSEDEDDDDDEEDEPHKAYILVNF